MNESLEWKPGTKLFDLRGRIVRECLRKNDGNRKATSEELGVSRRTVLNWIKIYKIDIKSKYGWEFRGNTSSNPNDTVLQSDNEHIITNHSS